MGVNTKPRQAVTEAQLHEVARLRLAVVRLARQIRRHARTGVTPTQLSALVALERHGPMTPARLAEHESISRSTVTRLVRSLEEAGLVERTTDPADRRSCTLQNTASAVRLLAESRERAESFLASRAALLSADETALLPRLSDLLERLGEQP